MDCAAQWGANQELEACRDWVSFYYGPGQAERLRIARRPKPPSEAEQALEDFEWLIGRTLGRPEFDERSDRILRALKSLRDTEEGLR
jgi:hypothetical protein